MENHTMLVGLRVFWGEDACILSVYVFLWLYFAIFNSCSGFCLCKRNWILLWVGSGWCMQVGREEAKMARAHALQMFALCMLSTHPLPICISEGWGCRTYRCHISANAWEQTLWLSITVWFLFLIILRFVLGGCALFFCSWTKYGGRVW